MRELMLGYPRREKKEKETGNSNGKHHLRLGRNSVYILLQDSNGCSGSKMQGKAAKETERA